VVKLIKMKVENLKKKSKGGKREGAGRKPGGMNKATKEQKIVEQEFKDRVLRSMGIIINSQMNLALGCQYLYKIVTKTDSKGVQHRSKPIMVTDQDEIELYLAGENKDDNDDYYYLTTDKPDNKALDSLIDRVFGKSISKTEITGKDGEQLGVVILPQRNENTLGTNIQTGGSSC
jgi:hypothetical protein